MTKVWLALALTLTPAVAIAQEDLGASEIIVTSSRREADGYDDRVPVIGLRQRADFALQLVAVRGDTRDEATRHEEMYRMIGGAVAVAAANGVQLVTGDETVEPLSADNYRGLTFKDDSRPDTSRAVFYVKTALGRKGDARAALSRIDRFLKAVPAVGRALIERSGDLTLSVVRPDQYRLQILTLVAEDARNVAARFGPDYAIEARGADRPVEWARAGLTDVFLYVPYQVTVVPRPR